MKFLLKLKHWQLFLITWGPIVINIFIFSDDELMARFFPIIMFALIIGILGWIWAISTVLHKKLPAGANLNLRRFKLFFLIPIVYMLSLTAFLVYRIYFRFSHANDNLAPVIGVVVFVHFVSMVCILLGLRFAAKTMRSVELGRPVNFSDYAKEFLLICFSPIGFWVLQPRLNKLAD
jgi:hypothetical protein